MNYEGLMQDAELKEKLENAQTLAEVVEIYKTKGIEVTEEQLQAALDAPENGELNEETLENVAGGILLWPIPLWPPFRPWPKRWPWRGR